MFFHQRKAGGGSVRYALVAEAQRLKLPYYVPCFKKLHCDTYNAGDAAAAIYAGHFPWGVQAELTRRATYDAEARAWRSPRDGASCLTLFREPLPRLESCYYFRFVTVRRRCARRPPK